MNLATYESVVCSLRKKGWDQQVALHELCQEFPQERKESLRSIISQEFQRQVKKDFKVSHSGHNKKKVYKRFTNEVRSKDYQPGVLIQLARENNTSSALTARTVLEEYLTEAGEAEELEDKAMRDKTIKNRAGKLMRDTTLLEEGELGYELLLAGLQDDCYGPLSEAIKGSIGEEHEQRLKDLLDRLDIPFCDENVLRVQGYDKTPDIKLEVPIAVDGHVVNWIESKALFGDPEAHAGYLKDQFWSYWNRFGPGLVIYWFGYVVQLDSHRGDGIMLSDHLDPDKITRFRPELRASHGLSEGSKDDVTSVVK